MKSFHLLKVGGWGARKVYPVLRGGGGQKVSDQSLNRFVTLLNLCGISCTVVFIGKRKIT